MFLIKICLLGFGLGLFGFDFGLFSFGCVIALRLLSSGLGWNWINGRC
jgi:hypothetical protein